VKYEQVRVKLPPFISQHKNRLAWGWVSVHVRVCVLTHLWRRFPGPEGRCSCSCTQAVPVCLWERMRSKCGRTGVSEGRQDAAHGQVQRLGCAQHLAMGQLGRPVPIHTVVQIFTGAELLQVQRFFGSFRHSRLLRESFGVFFQFLCGNAMTCFGNWEK